MTRLYRVWARFEKFEGRQAGQWRVTSSYPDRSPSHYPDIDFSILVPGLLGIISSKPYRKGSIISPHKELNRALKARREASNGVPAKEIDDAIVKIIANHCIAISEPPPRYVYIPDYMAGEHIYGEYDQVMKLYWLEDGDGYSREQLAKEWPDAEFYQFKREGQTI